MNTRDDLLREIMKHAVSGHTGEGFNAFCNNPQHALEIINKYGYVLRPRIGGNPTENMASINDAEWMFPSHSAHPVYRSAA